MKAGELCTRSVVIAGPDLSVVDAARRMKEMHVGDLVVVEASNGENEPVGIVTDRDLVLEVLADNVGWASSLRVCEVMTSELVIARESDDVTNVLQAMRKSGVRRVPIVNEHGSLVGILSHDDVLSWLIEELSTLPAIFDRSGHVESQRVPAP